MAHYVHSSSSLSSRTHRSFAQRAQRKLCAISQSQLAVSDVTRTSRRTLLTILVGLGATSTQDARADPPPSQGEPTPAVAFPVSTPTPTPQPNDPTVFTYDFASDVPCNLRVREYWSIINQQRPKTWQQIAQQIQTGNYMMLSMNLNVVPMADLRQAALYLPWALLQNSDYNAAVDAFKAYKNFDDHVKDLQRAASAAAAFALNADPSQQAQQAQLAQQVQQAFILMSASLDGYLATVPARYTASLGLFQGRTAAPSQPEPQPQQQPQPQAEEQRPQAQP